jgi:catechol 2,3-dioxygenase-like lactoylglutathione lyase family enzyme
MNLGAFSVSLAVKNIEKSKAFYEKLGFTAFGGDLSQNWLILKNGDHCIGLFQGMFEGNLLTFNPGWDQNAQALEAFTDIRELHQALKTKGVEMADGSITGDRGPASFTLVDPDGNAILIDQHV